MLSNLCSFKDEVLNADLLFAGQTQLIFINESDSERLTVHGLLTTGPVCILILRLQVKGENSL